MRLRRGDLRRLIWGERMRAEPAVIIPCKALASGKSRLAPVLSRDARARLCARLLQHTLDVATALVPRFNVWLVTSDPEALQLADRCGVGILDQAFDAYAALRYLSQLYFVDPARVAVLGNSMGGFAVLYAVDRDLTAQSPSGFALRSPITPAVTSRRQR